MGLISTIKELLGLDTGEPDYRRDVEVTVERETTAESERAVKEPVASASTADESPADAEPAGAPDAEAESDAVTGESAEEAGQAATAESSDEAGTAEDSTAEPERGAEETAGDDALTSIKGIGDAYAERLAAAGIETVGDLAEADADTVAEEADVPPTRLERWIERANSRR